MLERTPFFVRSASLARAWARTRSLAAGMALLLSAAGCSEESNESVWPTGSQTATKVTSSSEEERVDLYGDRLPSGAVARLGSVRMFDRKLGRVIFSSDGSEIVTSSEESYLIWQTTTAQRLGTLDIARAAPAMAMRGDGELLATAIYGGSIQLWSYSKRKPGAVLSGHRKLVTSLCFAGETLVSGSEDRSVRIWPPKAEGIVLRGEWESVSDVHCRESGVVMFADNQGSVWLTDTSGAEPVRFGFAKKRKSAQTAVYAVTMGSDKGPFAAALGDGTVAIWSTVKGTPRRFDAHALRVLSIAFTKTGQLMTSGGDAMFRIWDAKTGEKIEERKAAADVEAQLFELSSDGAFVAGFSELRDGRASEAGRFWLYEGGTGAQLLEPDRHTEGLTAVAFTPDGGEVITTADDGRVYRWNVNNASLIGKLSSQKGPVRALGFDAKSGSWFSVGDDARMHRSTIGGSDSIVLDPLGGAVHALAVEPSGGRLVIGDFAGKVVSFSRKSGSRLARHDAEAFSTIHALAFSPDGKTFVIAGGNRHIHIVSAASGKKITMLSPKDVVDNRAVAFSPDGKLLATGGDDHVVRLWSTSSWKQVAALEGHDGSIRAVAFSPDGRRLASGASDETARLWDVTAKEEITLFAGHRGAVTSVGFSPDSLLLATGSRDRTALIWKLPADSSRPGTGTGTGTGSAGDPPSKATLDASVVVPADAKAAAPLDAALAPVALDAAVVSAPIDGAPTPAKSDAAP